MNNLSVNNPPEINLQLISNDIRCMNADQDDQKRVDEKEINNIDQIFEDIILSIKARLELSKLILQAGIDQAREFDLEEKLCAEQVKLFEEVIENVLERTLNDLAEEEFEIKKEGNEIEAFEKSVYEIKKIMERCRANLSSDLQRIKLNAKTIADSNFQLCYSKEKWENLKQICREYSQPYAYYIKI